MVLKRDVCIIPPGRWMGSFSLQRCQSDGFEVCQLHKKSQTKRVEKRYGVRIWGGKLMSVFYIRTCCGFLQNFATGVLFMGLMRSMRSRRKKNGWNVPVDLSQQNYCAYCVRLLFQFAFVDFHMDVWAKLQQSAASSSKQASRRWKESESLNHSCRGGGLQSAPYLPFLIILNNLQFKEKSSYPVSHHQIMFFFFIKEVKSRFFHVLELVENSLLTAHSVDIQHMSRLKGFATPTDVFGTMGRQMSRPFTPCRGYEANGGEGNSEERPFSYYSN